MFILTLYKQQTQTTCPFIETLKSRETKTISILASQRLTL